MEGLELLYSSNLIVFMVAAAAASGAVTVLETLGIKYQGLYILNKGKKLCKDSFSHILISINDNSDILPSATLLRENTTKLFTK